jgi:thiol-disulfide isomerase/thioredoxin
VPAPPGSAPPAPPPVNTADPSTIAENKNTPYERDPKVNVPSPPGREHSPEKPSNVMPPPPPSDPTEAPPSDAVKADIPDTKTLVPSCVRSGSRVENFALYGTKGDVYELAKDRKGKLVLVDLWHTRCSPCLRAIPHLNKLHNKYSRHGLEIIGVAYEKGTLEEKQQALERASQRNNLTFNYRVLFGGGGGRVPCPVAEQLECNSTYPTLVLLDETGKIIYRAQGLDERAAYELEMAIHHQLFHGRTARR